MKIYERKKENLIRIIISKKGENTLNLTLAETTLKEVFDLVKNEFVDTGNPKQIKTRIDVREYANGVNGTCKSHSFKGLDVYSTEGKFLKNILKLKQ